MSEKDGSVGNASRSIGSRGGRSEADEGEPQPPSVTRPSKPRPLDLRLNTPQADEGPEQPGGGVPILPQPRATENRKTMSDVIANQTRALASVTPPTVRAATLPPSSDSVVGFTEDGPIRSSNRAASAPAARYSPGSPSRESRQAQPPAVSPRESPSPPPQSLEARRSSPEAPSSSTPSPSSSSPRRSAPSNNNERAAVGAATGVAAAATASGDTNGAAALREEDKEPTCTCSKKNLIIGGIVAAVIVVVLVVVLVLFVGGDDPPTPSPTSNDTSTPGPTPGTSVGEDESILTLASIAEHGTLKCGIGMQQGFGSVNDSGEYEGFNADLVSFKLS